jgi:hypothetical protein
MMDSLPRGPLIEVIASTENKTDPPPKSPIHSSSARCNANPSLLPFEHKDDDDEEEIQLMTTLRIGPPSYGFNNRFSDFFKCWHSGEVSEIIALPCPDTTPPQDRPRLQEAAEDEAFDIERYMMDLANQAEDEYFLQSMKFVRFWDRQSAIQILEKMDVNNASSPPPLFLFTETENELLRRLRNREYVLSRGELSIVVGGLVDLLIAYAYDHRTTQGEPTVESAWTIAILSPTLSWLNSSADLNVVVKSAIRRILTYPLLRQHDLALQVIADVVNVLQRGKFFVVRCLLSMHAILAKAECHYYLLNTLYVEDYCVWMQQQSDHLLQDVASALATVAETRFHRSNKDACGWALDLMEKMLFEEHTEDEDREEILHVSSLSTLAAC